ncbi:MAG: hypothetical protein V1821_00950 [bacterium]
MNNKLIAAIAGLVVVAGIGFGGYYGYKAVTEPAGQGASKAEKGDSLKFTEMKSGDFSLSGSVKSNSDAATLGQGTLDFSAAGSLSIQDPENPILESDLSFKLMQGQVGEPLIDAVLAVKGIGQRFYFKLDKLTLPKQMALPIDVSPYLAKWMFAESKDKTATAEDLTAEDKRIVELFNKTHFLIVKQDLGVAVIDGGSGRKYLVRLDETAAKGFLQELLKLSKSDLSSAEEAQAYDAVTVLSKEDITIVKDEAGYLREISLGGSTPEATYAFTLRFSNINKVVQVTEPTGATNFEEVVKSFMGGMAPGLVPNN